MKALTAIRLPLFAIAAMVVAGSASATYNHYYNYYNNWNNCYPQQPAPPPDQCVVEATADNDCKSDSYNNAKFWSFSFLEAVCDDAFIKEICIDLRAGSDSNAYFDLSGGYANGTAFGPKIGKLDGISASDVSFTPGTGKSSVLCVTFADGAFNVGDSIWFGADTDKLGNDDAASVGLKGVGLTVTFGNGSSYSTSFAKYGHNLSKAKVKADDCCGGTVIPTPSAVGLGMLMLGGVAVRRRRSVA